MFDAPVIDQNNPIAKNFIYLFAWFWSITSVLYFFCVTFIPMPQGSRDFANIILGFLLGTAVATIISFFYGSSKSSKDKTDAMMKANDVSLA
jgi:predicted membrane channel-forming protein YqfA (hemolysin III family)